ncbi:hypothetical protein WG78_16470 [Amantichitinum ursilacus]|uniref:Roadblock/LAMTOR2 domain-containing protein n=2 Tax=Amantichitinum ursilacus TaxID=857265 RepID=A0A0N0GM26_9NEIS|nr:hypothetical protein WG78_16470 [Amantichitinum ursilacus]
MATVRQLMQEVIGQLFDRVSETRAALVSTADGMPLVSRFDTETDNNRVSAIFSSLLAVCETASKEINAGACQRAVVCADHANIVMVRIHLKGRVFTLALAFDADLMLGTALRTTTDLAQRIEQALAVAMPA